MGEGGKGGGGGGGGTNPRLSGEELSLPVASGGLQNEKEREKEERRGAGRGGGGGGGAAENKKRRGRRKRRGGGGGGGAENEKEREKEGRRRGCRRQKPQNLRRPWIITVQCTSPRLLETRAGATLTTFTTKTRHPFSHERECEARQKDLRDPSA